MKSVKKSHRASAFQRRLLPALVTAALTAGWAQAQVAAKPAADSKESTQLEAVTVTATKRAAPLQSVPIAISVISGAQLEKSNLNTLGAITTQTPTLNFRTGASNKDTSLFIRGVGTVSTSPGIEPTVSTVIDGVVSARPGQSTMDLLDVDRVEILRGPQGTLFGKNASAGVINIITRSPSAQTERYIDLSYFQGNEKRLRLGASGEIMPGVARGSISALYGDYAGGITNVFDGSKVGGYQRNGIRGKLDLTPNRDMKISLIADVTNAKDNGPTGVPTNLRVTAYPSGVVGAPNLLYAAAVLPVVPSPENRSINSEMETRVKDRNMGVSGQLDWNIGDYTLTSITALRKWENTQFQDQDRLPKVYRQFAQTADRGDVAFSQTTQELRLASPKGNFIDYVGGLFFMRADGDEIYRREVTRCASSTATALPSGLVPCTAASTTVDSGTANYSVLSNSASLFGESVLNFTPAVRGILGFRYTQDRLSYDHRRISTQAAAFPGVRPAFAANGKTSETGYSGRVGPQIDLSKDAMVYATYSRGYKGPAYNVFFNMTDFDMLALKPETSDSMEIGLKSTILNNRVRLNFAAFDTKYDNYQSNLNDLVGTTIVTRLINAGSVSTKGVEMDFAAKITPDFTISGAAARINARIDKFNCPPGASASCDVNGKPLPFSPDWRVNLRANYKMQVMNGWTMDLSSDYAWQSEVLYDIGQAPDAIQPSYGIVNASVALYKSDSGWRFALIGKNLADKSYSNLLFNGGGFFARAVPRDDKRYFGVNARLDF